MNQQTDRFRSLLSEGRVRYETIDNTSEGLKPRLIEREGPTGLITTTTAVSLHPENETRLLSLQVIDTADQTKKIMLALATGQPDEPTFEPWHALQTFLEYQPSEVTIPFAVEMANLIPPKSVRLRRDFSALLSLVRAHALLHQDSRDRDHQGRIVATLEDYEVARGLVADLVAEGVEATVPVTIRETVGAVKVLVASMREDDGPTVKRVSEELGLDKSAALRRVKKALQFGYLKNLETPGQGRPYRLRPADPLPEDVEILPTVERLEAEIQGGTVAPDQEGLRPPSSPESAEEEAEESSLDQAADYIFEHFPGTTDVTIETHRNVDWGEDGIHMG